MRTSFLSTIVISGALAIGSAAQASPVAADFTGGNSYSVGTFNNVGWSFAVTTSTTIDGLGIFDFDANGLTNSHQVGLWNSVGTLLAQATVSNASSVVSSAATQGRWLFEDIAAITLVTGNYVVGAFYSGDDADSVLADATGLAMAAGLTYTASLATGGSPSFAEPGSYGIVQPGVFGPNLRFASVPEPTSLALVMLALCGAGLAKRRRQQRAA